MKGFWKWSGPVALAVALVAGVLVAVDLATPAEEPVARTYGCAVYTEQGCSKFVVASGGEIEVQSGGTFDLQSGATTDFSSGIDLDGGLLDLDADGDTSMQADTDDQIDIEISAADDFQFTANTFTALSGSTIAANTIAETTATSGVTVDGLTLKDGGVQDSAGLDVIGIADTQQVVVTGYSTQTSASLVVEDSSNADVFVVAEAPAAGSGGDLVDVTDTFGAMNGSDALIGLDMNLTGANHTGTGNSLVGIDADLTTADAQVSEVAINLNDSDWEYAIDAGAVPIVSTAQTWMEDFFGDVIPDEVVLLSGTDAQAVDPALAQDQYGVVTLVSGDANTDCATDCSELALGLHWSADQGSLIFETRLHLDGSIDNAHLCAGLTDVATLEMPFSIGAADNITSTASNALAFCYTVDAGTAEWFTLGVAGDTDATGNAACGTAPAADTYQVLRIEVDAGGNDARFYINGTLEGTLTANAVTAATLLTPFVTVDTDTTSSITVDVDYIYTSAQRQ